MEIKPSAIPPELEGVTIGDILDATSDALLVHDENGKIVYVNRQTEAMFGFSAHDLSTVSLEELSLGEPPYSQAEAMTQIAEALEHGSCVFPWRSRRISGELFWSEVALRSSTISGKKWVIASVRDISAQRQAEDALRQNEAKLSKIFHGSSGAMATTELATGNIIDVNETWVRMSGISLKEANDKRALEQGLWASQDEREECVRLLARNGAVRDFEAVLVMKGKRRSFLISAQTLDFDGGALVLWEFRDVTPLKRTLEALAERDSKLEAISDHFSEGMIYQMLIKPDGTRKFTYLSESVRELYGITPEEGMADSGLIYGKVHKDDIDHLIQAEEEAIETLTTFRTEARIIGPSGQIRWSSLVSTPVKLKDGSTRWDGIEFNITERKRAEEALRASEALFNKAFYHSPTLMMLADLDTKSILAVNDSYCRIMGYSQSEVVNQLGKLGFSLKFRDSLEALLEQLSLHGRVSDYEITVLSKRGEEVVGLISAEVVNIHNQRVAIINMIDITAYKKAQDALRQSEADLKKAQAIAHVGSYFWRLEDNSVYWSDEMKAILGCEKESPSFERMISLIHPDDHDMVVETGRLAREAGSDFDLEYRIMRPDGTMRHVHDVAEISRTKDGTVCSMFGTTQDITERRKQEEELRLALEESQLRQKEVSALLEASRAIPHYESFDQAARRIFDIAKAHIGAKSGYVALLSADGEENEVRFLDAGVLPCTVDPELPMPIRGLREVAYQTGDVVYDNNFPSSEWMAFMPTGHVRLENMLFSPLYIEGKTVGLIGLANKPNGFTPDDANMARAFGDLAAVALTYTEKRQQLVESEELFRTVADYTYDWEYWQLPDGSLKYMSPSCLRITGYTQQEFMSAPSLIGSIVLEEDRQVWNQHNTEAHEREEYLEFRITRRDGQVRWIGHECHFIYDAEGQFIGNRVSNRDITALKSMYEQLQQSQKMRAIGQLAGGIAHDFNNVLGGIIGFADMAYEEVADNPTFARYMQNILKAGERAKHLVNQILTFSRQSAEEKHPINLRPILVEVVDLLRASLPSSVELKTHIEKDTSPVSADPTKVHEALMNLATNAVHAMDEKGTLTISLREVQIRTAEKCVAGLLAPGFYGVIEVRDTGSGIDSSVFEHIFEPFFTTKHKSKGTGLGLSVVFGVMQSHEGNIQVESTVGVGTTFRLFFPKCDQAVSTVTQIRPKIKGGSECILFVDDDDLIREMAKMALESLGYQVISTASSEEALKLFTDSPEAFDLLVTDQTMPRMTGVELSSAVARIRPGFPMVLITGFSTKVNRANAEQMGIRFFAEKPLTKSAMADIVRAALDSSK